MPKLGLEEAIPRRRLHDNQVEPDIRPLLDNLPLAAYTCDAQGLITYFNHHAVKIWGREPKLNDPEDRFCGSFRLFAMDGAPISHDHCWMARALRENRAFDGQEIVIERPDGRRFTAIAHVKPIHDRSGALSGAVNILIDITDQVRADETQARLAAIVESSDDAIIGKTLDGCIVAWNSGAQRIFGYTPEEAVGQSILLIIPPERRDEEKAILARLVRGERIDHYETVRLTKDGRRLDISLTSSPIRDAGGRIIGASKVARDITAWKRAEQALRESDRIKDEFLAMLAHELRNPLAPIRNAVQFLALQSPHNPQSEWAWEVIDRQVTQMVRIVDDLLDISRITRKKLVLRKERVKLEDVVQGALEASRPFMDAGGHVLTITPTTRTIYLDADPARLTQAISNLLNNAAKYTERGGQIWLTAERQGNDAVVSVRDSGVGIPAEMLPQVFEMFMQVDRSLERSQGGLGIGLTLVKQIAELHGGTAQAHSDGPGKGSEFILRLPVVIEPSRAQASTNGEQTPAGPSLRILIVDDNRDSAESMSMLLQLMGNEVRTAHDGEEAVEAARDFRPDAVALDIGLPKMNGYDTAKEMRRQPWGRELVLIAVTGWGQEQDKQSAKDAGFDHHMVKPVDAVTLMRVVSRFVAKRPR